MITTIDPGDILLTRANTTLSWFIRFGQALKFGKQRQYAHWSHAALIVSPNGDLIEAHSKGIRHANIKEYQHKGTEYVHVPVQMDEHDRAQVLAFAESQVGKWYAFATFASLILNLLTPRRIFFGIDNTEICSTFVARALERAGYVFPHSPAAIVPADLALYFRVDPQA